MKNTLRGLCGLLLPVVLLVMAACVRQKPASVALGPEAIFSEFVGNAACQPCHAAEFTSHQKSRHMSTLHDATPAALGSLAPALGVTPGGIALTQEGAGLAVKMAKKSGTQTVPLAFVLGSGKTGMTFLALLEQGSAEIFQSYFPNQKKWHTTPGQQDYAHGSLGRPYDESTTRHCLGCHTVTLPLDSLKPERRFYGVGCEACHGPGSRHVAAKQQGRKTDDSRLRQFDRSSGKAVNELCGRCHRTATDLATMDPREKASTQRFQPFGLSLSKCFIQSKDQLTCVTCHNPHEDASTDQRRYEKTCLSCHSSPRKTCPVNTTEKCVSCHMPTRAVFPGSPLPNQMADHFIKIYRQP